MAANEPMQQVHDITRLIGRRRTTANDGEQWSGAQGRNRTTDTAIFNRMLYQLSYLGAKSAQSERATEARAL